MVLFSQCKFQFKTCFVFLVFITFAVSVTLYISNTSLKPSKAWFSNIAQQISSYYRSTEIHIGNNQTLIILPSFPERSGSETRTLGDTHQTIKNGHNDTKDVNQELTKKTVLVEQAEQKFYHYGYPRNYRFIINEPDKCKQQDPFLVLMVPVAPQQLEARNAIRSTWGNESMVQDKKITVIFVVGLPGGADAEKQQEKLRLESQQQHDLVQSNFVDTYLNLTIKTMVIMDWLATHCPQATFAMKVDSDMFLNLENLMKLLLASETPKENYITGMVMWNRPVVRNTNSKWFVSKDLYPEDIYPTYLLGMGYVFSNDLPEKLVDVSKDIKPFNIEDAYVGACLKKIGILPSNPPDPSQFRAYFSGTYIRTEFEKVITTILWSPQQLVTFWKDLKRPTQ